MTDQNTTDTQEPGFSRPERQALGALVARIIPPSKERGLPGADDPEILADILRSAAPLRDQLSGALAGFATTGQSPDDFRRTFPQEAGLIQTLTMLCYYRDTAVMHALGIDPDPPFPKGFALAPNDLSILEPVRRRGPLYRKVQ